MKPLGSYFPQREFLSPPLQSNKPLPYINVQKCAAIRLAEPGDTPALAAIEDASRPGGNWNPAQVAEELERERATVLLDEQPNGKVTGWIVTWRVPPDELHILELAVCPTHRRKGIATSLLLAALNKQHRQEDTTLVLLEVRASNKSAISMYEKAGFIAVGKRRKFYSDGEDAILMNCDLHSIPVENLIINTQF
jgi:ribosomal-protein-alanine N-acetyltransferase